MELAVDDEVAKASFATSSVPMSSSLEMEEERDDVLSESNGWVQVTES